MRSDAPAAIRYSQRSHAAVRLELRAVLRTALTLGVGLLASCAPEFFVVRNGARPPTVRIEQLELKWSNVFLLRSPDGSVLIDSGSPGEWNKFVHALQGVGLTPGELRLVVQTHGHADHSGLASQLQAAGVPIALGRGDVHMAVRGRNDPLQPTGFVARVLRPLFEFPYTPYHPDVVVDDTLDLTAYGIPGARVELLPGHTPGALVVWVGPHDVIAGDEMLGGALATFATHSPREHYYQSDPIANHCNVEHLLAAGAQRFYLGHGGPVDRDAVMHWRRTWLNDLSHCPPSRTIARSPAATHTDAEASSSSSPPSP